MALPKLIYDAGSGAVTLLFKRGPNSFICRPKARLNDNVATSGLRERVLEGIDLLIEFQMPALVVTDDLPAWQVFQAWALLGGQFQFFPDADGADYYNCVSDDEGFHLARQGPGRYSASLAWRIIPDAQAPANAGVVMQRFYGVTE